MKKLRVLQILNFWRLIPAYMCICMAPVEVKHVVIEELYHWKNVIREKKFPDLIFFWIDVGTERVSVVAAIPIQSGGGQTFAEGFVSWDGNALY